MKKIISPMIFLAVMMTVVPPSARAESGGAQVNERLEGFAVSFTGTITVKSAGARTPSKFPPGSSGAIMPGDEVAVISGEASFAGNGMKITAGPGAAFKIADNESPLPQDRAFGIVSTGGAPLTVTTKDGSTTLAPGRIYRITNVRVNASSVKPGGLAKRTGDRIAPAAPAGGDVKKRKHSYKGIVTLVRGPRSTQTYTSEGLAEPEIDHILPAAPTGGEFKKRKHNYKGTVTLVRGPRSTETHTSDGLAEPQGQRAPRKQGDSFPYSLTMTNGGTLALGSGGSVQSGDEQGIRESPSHQSLGNPHIADQVDVSSSNGKGALANLSGNNTWTGTIVLASAPKDGNPVSYKGHKGIFKNIKGFTATIVWGDGSTSQGAISVSPEKDADGEPLSYTVTFQGSLSGSAASGIFDRWGNEITEDEKRGKWLPPSPIPPDLEMAAKKALQDLADAYSAKNRSAFMRLLSEDFAGDLSTLEDALIKDFRSYRSVNLDLIPDRVDIQGASASVEFHYNLTVVSDQGANDKFSGRSSYVFHQEDGKARLYKMENPILFGNSLPPSENPIAVSQNPVLSAGSTAPGAQNVIRGSATITPGRPGGAGGPGTPGSGFKFSTQSNVPDSSADIFKQGGNIAANQEGAIVLIGSCNLDSVTKAPASITGSSAAANAGECYAVRTAADKYAVLRVTSTGGALGGTSTTSFDYKFQPSGSTSF